MISHNISGINVRIATFIFHDDDVTRKIGCVNVSDPVKELVDAHNGVRSTIKDGLYKNHNDCKGTNGRLRCFCK